MLNQITEIIYMSEALGLVSWDKPVELGKVPGSDWICPVGSIDALGEIERAGSEITNEDLLMADGRRQHLEMVQFPEGYRSARVIDSESGEVITDVSRTERYLGLISCGCGAIHDTPSITGVLSGRPHDLGEGLQLEGVSNLYSGTETVISPTMVARSEADYFSRRRSRMRITPQSRSLFLTSEGRVAAINGGYARFDLLEDARDDGVETSAELDLMVSDERDRLGSMNLKLDSQGQVERLMVFKRGLMDALGISIDIDPIPGSFDWGEVSDPRGQTLVMDAVADVLGLGKWKGLDLRQTASGLYAAMAQRNLDPTSSFVPRN